MTVSPTARLTVTVPLRHVCVFTAPVFGAAVGETVI